MRRAQSQFLVLLVAIALPWSATCVYAQQAPNPASGAALVADGSTGAHHVVRTHITIDGKPLQQQKLTLDCPEHYVAVEDLGWVRADNIFTIHLTENGKGSLRDHGIYPWAPGHWRPADAYGSTEASKRLGRDILWLEKPTDFRLVTLSVCSTSSCNERHKTTFYVRDYQRGISLRTLDTFTWHNGVQCPTVGCDDHLRDWQREAITLPQQAAKCWIVKYQEPPGNQFGFR